MASQGRSAVTPPPSLQDRIQTLTDVRGRLEMLRHVPSMLLRPPLSSPLGGFPPAFDPAMDREFAATFDSTPTHDFGALKEFSELVRSDKVQEALEAARVSEDADRTRVGLSFWRDDRKRKRPQSPVGSPQPYVLPVPRSSSLFGGIEDDAPPMRAESLVEFVREFNRGSVETDVSLVKCKLAIWTRTKTMRDSLKDRGESHGVFNSPVVLRFMIPDVLTGYISLVFASMESPVVVESVGVFGPRERKLPHEQSEYLVFQGLSQHVTKMILSHPRVAIQSVMSVLLSYRGLFVDQCTTCQRVLSVEGHIPPVARVWVGHWDPRHSCCVYN